MDQDLAGEVALGGGWRALAAPNFFRERGEVGSGETGGGAWDVAFPFFSLFP